jgi:NgoFVII restriction endonuclease.
MENYSLFDVEQTDTPQPSNKLNIVQMQFIDATAMTWQELFNGYTKLYAITYSSSIGFIGELLKQFTYSEIIFGYDEVMSYNMQEIIAYQYSTIEELKANMKNIDLISKIDNGELQLYVAREQLSHEKIYLLENDNGAQRVILGSANMSYSAFGGKQRENICYIDGEKAFEWYKSNFDDLKESSTDNITVKAITVSDIGDNLDELPIAQTVKIRKALVIESTTEDVNFVLDVKNIAVKLASHMPKPDKLGKIKLSPEIIKTVKRNIISSIKKEQEIRNEFPQLIIDIENAKPTLNEVELDLSATDDDIRHDVKLFLNYMQGFDKFFGDKEELRKSYYKFMVWFFASPFMAYMRYKAHQYSWSKLQYPVFGIMYGRSMTGKTSFLETLYKMMIGQKTKLAATEFTKTNMNKLRQAVRGAPIIVDDIVKKRFDEHAVETIKNDDYGIADKDFYYPPVVISGNNDIKTVSQEITKRAVMCHVQAGTTQEASSTDNSIIKIQDEIGTALYRAYLKIMLLRLSECIEKERYDEKSSGVDILALSSEVLMDLFTQYSDENLPVYISHVKTLNYFEPKILSSHIIEKINTAWDCNRNAFVVDKKSNILRYNASDIDDAEDILIALPNNL